MTTQTIRSVVGALVATLLASCATTYDQNGRPVKSVTPGGAVAGAAAAGLLGYALSKDKKKKSKKKKHTDYRRDRHGRLLDHKGRLLNTDYDSNGYRYQNGKRIYNKRYDQDRRSSHRYDDRRDDRRYDDRRYRDHRYDDDRYRKPRPIAGYDRYGNPLYR